MREREKKRERVLFGEEDLGEREKGIGAETGRKRERRGSNICIVWGKILTFC